MFIAKRNVQQMPGMAMEDPNNLLIQSPDGTFTEAGLRAGIASLHRGRGAALVDFNDDGRLDLAVVNRVAPLEIWRNDSDPIGAWIRVSVKQPAPNTQAIGAWIEVKDSRGIQRREITIGGGHAGGVAGPEHFGLGLTQEVQLRVIWPDGTASDWQAVTPNQNVEIRRIP